MESLKNLLAWFNDNYAVLSAIIVLSAALGTKVYKSIKDYQSKADEEKQVWINKQIDIAKAALENSILKLIGDAEIKWDSYVKSGAIKRSELFNTIYEKFPVLAEYMSTDELVIYIDKLIDNSLDILKDIMEQDEI